MYLSNFEYFRVNERGDKTKITQSLTERLFNTKVDIERQALQQDRFKSLGGITVVFKDQLPKARSVLAIIDPY